MPPMRACLNARNKKIYCRRNKSKFLRENEIYRLYCTQEKGPSVSYDLVSIAPFDEVLLKLEYEDLASKDGSPISKKARLAPSRATASKSEQTDVIPDADVKDL